MAGDGCDEDYMKQPVLVNSFILSAGEAHRLLRLNIKGKSSQTVSLL